MNHCQKLITDNDVTLIVMSANTKTGTNATADPLSQLGAKVYRKRKEGLQISQDELIARMNQTVYRPDVARQSHISNIENSDGEKLPSIRVLAALSVPAVSAACASTKKAGGSIAASALCAAWMPSKAAAASLRQPSSVTYGACISVDMLSKLSRRSCSGVMICCM